MVLVLAVGGLLLWQAAPARPVTAVETCAPPVARMRASRRKISRDAVVRRSKFHASRAPGPLCERALGFISRHARGRVLRPARGFARPPAPARFAPARCWRAPVPSLSPTPWRRLSRDDSAGAGARPEVRALSIVKYVDEERAAS